MARVSVVLSTYNKREMVAEALDSVLAQTYKDCEVLLVDDGSTDATPAYLFARFGAQPKAQKIVSAMNPTSMRPFKHGFTSNGTTIVYHYITNRGLSAARNWGIQLTRSRHIALLEAEDVWNSRHLETHMRFHKDHPGAMVTRVGERCGKAAEKSRAAKTTLGPSGWIFEQAVHSSPMCTSTALIRKTCFQECGAFDENLPACEDYDLWLRLAARYPIYGLEGATVTRRSPRRDSSSRSWSWDRFRVYALEKAFQSGHLSSTQRFLVAEEIVRKCERLVDGFRRHKSAERSNFYERKRKRFVLEVRKLRASQIAKAQE
jgi:glycosyltransferase involved in cell wall biosynthesis